LQLRTAHDRRVGAVRQLAQVVLCLKREAVVQRADAAGQVAASAEPQHGDLIRMDPPLLGAGAHDPNGPGGVHERRRMDVRTDAVLEDEGVETGCVAALLQHADRALSLWVPTLHTGARRTDSDLVALVVGRAPPVSTTRHNEHGT
jgi:hypothetical protein